MRRLLFVCGQPGQSCCVDRVFELFVVEVSGAHRDDRGGNGATGNQRR